MKKLTGVILITLLVAIPIIGADIVTPITAQAPATLKIGDYVQMGKYNDETILWRCVDIDENGPLMLADKILSIKPFDAEGKHKYADGTPQADSKTNYRTLSGSNLWETSNIRCWLNSKEAAGKVIWLDGVPSIENVRFHQGDYSNEKGFLAEGNFTPSEVNAVKNVTQKSLLNNLDAPKLSTGVTANRYYHNVTDMMFLLDEEQVSKVYQNRGTLGTNYYIGKPTQKAVDDEESKQLRLSTKGLSPAQYWKSWLRSPYWDPLFPDRVESVHFAGYVSDYQAFLRQFGEHLHIDDNSHVFVIDESANNTDIGVRPSFYINLSSATFKSGNGSVNNPYVVNEYTKNDGSSFNLVGEIIQQSKERETPYILYGGYILAIFILGIMTLASLIKSKNLKTPVIEVNFATREGRIQDVIPSENLKKETQLKRVYQNAPKMKEYEQKYKGAFGVLYFLGGFNLVAGLVFVFIKVDSLGLFLDVPFMIIFGLAFLVLGFFVQKKSNSALIMATTIWGWDTLRLILIMIVMVLMGYSLLSPILAWFIGHLIFINPMISGISAINHLKQKEKYGELTQAPLQEFCSKCGTKLTDDAKFCPICKNPSPDEVKKRNSNLKVAIIVIISSLVFAALFSILAIFYLLSHL